MISFIIYCTIVLNVHSVVHRTPGVRNYFHLFSSNAFGLILIIIVTIILIIIIITVIILVIMTMIIANKINVMENSVLLRVYLRASNSVYTIHIYYIFYYTVKDF